MQMVTFEMDFSYDVTDIPCNYRTVRDNDFNSNNFFTPISWSSVLKALYVSSIRIFCCLSISCPENNWLILKAMRWQHHIRGQPKKKIVSMVARRHISITGNKQRNKNGWYGDGDGDNLCQHTLYSSLTRDLGTSADSLSIANCPTSPQYSPTSPGNDDCNNKISRSSSSAIRGGGD